jgi:quinolinate synthase
MINGARCISEIKSRVTMAKEALKKKNSFHQQTGLTFMEETSKVLHLEQRFV